MAGPYFVMQVAPRVDAETFNMRAFQRRCMI